MYISKQLFKLLQISLITLMFGLFASSTHAAKISAGQYHTCGVSDIGAVKCWGDNRWGQLGNNSNAYRTTPVDVVSLSSGVTAVAMGSAHTCALTNAGAVKCWGLNNGGQLGDNGTTNRPVPVDVVDLSSGVSAIAAGGIYTCALTSAGAVKCWGGNYYGALGDNSTVDRHTPVDVVGLSSGVTAIAAGYYHSCALTSAGAVKCWGDNSYGELGDNSTTQRNTPVDVVGLSSGVSAIAAGGDHTCALTNVGAVKCWGANFNGQLGDNSITNRYAPVDVVGLSSGVSVISVGNIHTCALTNTGAVKCWGYNVYGQLGDSTTTDRYTPVDVTGLSSGVSAIAGGGSHSCMLTNAGVVSCWGRNNYGQLGDNSITDRHTPVDVFNLSDTDGDGVAETIDNCVNTPNSDQANNDGDAQGDVCDMDDDNDSVLDTVDNCPVIANANQLNTDGDTKGDVCDSDQVNAEIVTKVVALQQQTCALTSAGAVKCWGRVGSTNRHTPMEVVGVGSGVSSITVSCALTNAGTVQCWQGTPGMSSGVSAITYSCALTSVGGAKCWGSSQYGQLGNGTGDGGSPPSPTPVDVVGLSSGVSAIARTGYHTCVLTNTGAVKCWGWNFYGQLGDNKLSGNMSNTPVDVVGLSSGVSAIATGRNHTCALTSTGGVKCWGYNNSGQLGDNSTTQRNTPVDVVGLGSGVSAITAGEYHTCALTNIGGVKCWGYNYIGALGDNSTEQRNTPVDVVGLSGGVSAIAAGSLHTCALISGAVKCWGGDSYGELGDNGGSRLTPTTFVSGLSGDSDQDGMPDLWEIQYGLNPQDPSDANGDLDGDSYSNKTEFYNGIDPTVANTKIRNDFGGDRKADVLLRNTTTGDWNLASLNGLTVLNQSTVGAFSDIENVIVSTGDFDGDGDADILTRGTDDGLLPGTFRIELTAGATVTDAAWLFTMSTDTSDVVMSTQDFNKDGKADVLLRNSATGVWTINYMNGTSDPATGTLNASTDICYAMKGDGDYDGNGYPDLLLRKDACGGASYPWLISTTDGDTTILASGTATGVSLNTGWAAVVTDKDFNGDGKSDLLIRALTGSVQQWLLYDMDGFNAPSASGLLNIAVQSMWQYAANTDFNGDGKEDLVLRSTDTGQWYGYLLNGRTILSASTVSLAMNPIWTLQALDDNNSDGKADILLRNSASGNWWLYLMNGLTVQSNSALPITTDLNYTLQND